MKYSVPILFDDRPKHFVTYFNALDDGFDRTGFLILRFPNILPFMLIKI